MRSPEQMAPKRDGEPGSISPYTWKRVRTGHWGMVTPVPALPRPAVAGDADFDIVTRRVIHDTMDVGNVNFEILSLGTVDMEEFEQSMDQEALLDENWLWDEPQLLYNPKDMDEAELC